MTRLGRAALLLGLGVVAAYLFVSGEFGQFLQQRMGIPLLLAALVLLVLGAYEARGALDEESAAGPDHDGHDHHHHDPHHNEESRGPRVGWLLVLPVLVLVAVAPSALGAAASDRVPPLTPVKPPYDLEPLDASDPPVGMLVYDFLERAIWDETGSLEGVPVRLEGLVVNDPLLRDGFMLTRFLVSCCAADGIPVRVALHGPPDRLPDDTWVRVDLLWRPPPEGYPHWTEEILVEADALDVVVIDAPSDPYEPPA